MLLLSTVHPDCITAYWIERTRSNQGWLEQELRQILVKIHTEKYYCLILYRIQRYYHSTAYGEFILYSFVQCYRIFAQKKTDIHTAHCYLMCQFFEFKQEEDKEAECLEQSATFFTLDRSLLIPKNPALSFYATFFLSLWNFLWNQENKNKNPNININIKNEIKWMLYMTYHMKAMSWKLLP